MDLGLMLPRFEEIKSLSDERYDLLYSIIEKEEERLRHLPPDDESWGGWNSEIHAAKEQKNRQYRAYCELEIGKIKPSDDGCIIVNPRTGINLVEANKQTCSCGTYSENLLPCEHIYASAILGGEALHVTRAIFEAIYDSEIQEMSGWDYAIPFKV
jgi:hypothetical protein